MMSASALERCRSTESPNEEDIAQQLRERTLGGAFVSLRTAPSTRIVHAHTRVHATVLRVGYCESLFGDAISRKDGPQKDLRSRVARLVKVDEARVERDLPCPWLLFQCANDENCVDSHPLGAKVAIVFGEYALPFALRIIIKMAGDNCFEEHLGCVFHEGNACL